MEWNERLKQARKSRRWTQDVLAEKLGTNRSTISRWEQGNDFPYPIHREKLTQLFGAIFDEIDFQDRDLAAHEPFAMRSGGEQVYYEHRVSQMLLASGAYVDKAIPSSVWTEHMVLEDPAIPQTLSYANSLLGRQDLVWQVKEHLLAGDEEACVALHGLPGVGKTDLAVVLATDEQVQAHFGDGVLWAGLGRRPNVLGQLARWGNLLGVLPSQVEDLKSREAWKRALQAAIGTRRILLVIDGACNIEDIEALQIGGSQCAYLLTTHISQVALTFAPQEAFLVSHLAESDGLALLARFVPRLIEQDPQGAQALVQALDSLPLALTLMGNALASQAFSKQPQPLQAAVKLLYTTEQRLKAYPPALAQSASPGLQAATCISVQQLSTQAYTVLCILAVFPPKPSTISQEAALAISQQPEILEELVAAGLLESWGPDRYTLHQIVADYAHTLIDDYQMHQQDKQAREDYLFSSPYLWSAWLHHKRRALPLRAASWPLVTLLLATLVIMLVLLAPFSWSGQATTSLTTHSAKAYEAEASENVLSGGARIHICLGCSGKICVIHIGHGATLQFNNVSANSTGKYKLTIYYMNGKTDRIIYLSVNGGSGIALFTPGIDNRNKAQAISTTVTLRAGNNTIKFYNPSFFGADIDRIVV